MSTITSTFKEESITTAQERTTAVKEEFLSISNENEETFKTNASSNEETGVEEESLSTIKGQKNNETIEGNISTENENDKSIMTDSVPTNLFLSGKNTIDIETTESKNIETTLEGNEPEEHKQTFVISKDTLTTEFGKEGIITTVIDKSNALKTLETTMESILTEFGVEEKSITSVKSAKSESLKMFEQTKIETLKSLSKQARSSTNLYISDKNVKDTETTETKNIKTTLEANEPEEYNQKSEISTATRTTEFGTEKFTATVINKNNESKPMETTIEPTVTEFGVAEKSVTSVSSVKFESSKIFEKVKLGNLETTEKMYTKVSSDNYSEFLKSSLTTKLDSNKKSTMETSTTHVSNGTTEVEKFWRHISEGNNTKLKENYQEVANRSDIEFLCDPCPSSLKQVKIKNNTLRTSMIEETTKGLFGQENAKETYAQDLKFLCDPCPNPTFKKIEPAEKSQEEELKETLKTTKKWYKTHNEVTKYPILTGKPINEDELKQITEGVNYVPQTKVKSTLTNLANEKISTESLQESTELFNNQTSEWFTTKSPTYFRNVTLGEDDLRHVEEGQTFISIQTPPIEPSTQELISQKTSHNLNEIKINMEEKELKQITESQENLSTAAISNEVEEIKKNEVEEQESEKTESIYKKKPHTSEMKKSTTKKEKQTEEIVEGFEKEYTTDVYQKITEKNMVLNTTFTNQINTSETDTMKKYKGTEYGAIKKESQTSQLEENITKEKNRELSTSKANILEDTEQKTFKIEKQQTDREVDELPKSISKASEEEITSYNFSTISTTLGMEELINVNEEAKLLLTTEFLPVETKYNLEANLSIQSTYPTMYKKGATRKYVNWYIEYPEEEEKEEIWPTIEERKRTSGYKIGENNVKSERMESKLKEFVKTTTFIVTDFDMEKASDKSVGSAKLDYFSPAQKERITDILKTTKVSKKRIHTKYGKEKEVTNKHSTKTDFLVTSKEAKIEETSEKPLTTEVMFTKESPFLSKDLTKTENVIPHIKEEPQATSEVMENLTTNEYSLKGKNLKTSESDTMLKHTTMLQKEKSEETEKFEIVLTTHYKEGENITKIMDKNIEPQTSGASTVSESFLHSKYSIEPGSHETTKETFKMGHCTANEVTDLEQTSENAFTTEASELEHLMTLEDESERRSKSIKELTTIEPSKEGNKEATVLKHTFPIQNEEVEKTSVSESLLMTKFIEPEGEKETTELVDVGLKSQQTAAEDISETLKISKGLVATDNGKEKVTDEMIKESPITEQYVNSDKKKLKKGTTEEFLISKFILTKDITSVSKEDAKSENTIIYEKQTSVKEPSISKNPMTIESGEEEIGTSAIKEEKISTKSEENIVSQQSLEEEEKSEIHEISKNDENQYSMETKKYKTTKKSTLSENNITRKETQTNARITQASTKLECIVTSNKESASSESISTEESKFLSSSPISPTLSKTDLELLFEGVKMTQPTERMPTEFPDYLSTSLNIHSTHSTVYQKGATKIYSDTFYDYPTYEKEPETNSRKHKYFSEQRIEDDELYSDIYSEAPEDHTSAIEEKYSNISTQFELSSNTIRTESGKYKNFSTFGTSTIISRKIDDSGSSKQPKNFEYSLNIASSLAEMTGREGDKLQTNIFSTKEGSNKTGLEILTNTTEKIPAYMFKETDEDNKSKEAFERLNSNFTTLSTMNDSTSMEKKIGFINKRKTEEFSDITKSSISESDREGETTKITKTYDKGCTQSSSEINLGFANLTTHSELQHFSKNSINNTTHFNTETEISQITRRVSDINANAEKDSTTFTPGNEEDIGGILEGAKSTDTVSTEETKTRKYSKSEIRETTGVVLYSENYSTTKKNKERTAYPEIRKTEKATLYMTEENEETSSTEGETSNKEKESEETEMVTEAGEGEDNATKEPNQTAEASTVTLCEFCDSEISSTSKSENKISSSTFYLEGSTEESTTPTLKESQGSSVFDKNPDEITTHEGGSEKAFSEESITSSEEPGASNKEFSEITAHEGESEESNASSDKLSTAKNTTASLSKSTYEGDINESITTSYESGKTDIEGGGGETSSSNIESSKITAPEGESEESNASSEKLRTAENGTETFSETTYEGDINDTITTSYESGKTDIEGGGEETSSSNKESSKITSPESEIKESNASNEKLSTAKNETETFSETTYEGGIKETITTSNESSTTGLEGSGEETSSSNTESSQITALESESEEYNASSKKLGSAENATEPLSETTYEGGIKESITTSNGSGKTGVEGGSEETSASNKESSKVTAPEAESEESNASSEKLNTAENSTELFSETTYEGGIKENITTSNESGKTGLEGGSKETSASNKESSKITAPEGKSEESNASSEILSTVENGSEPFSETTYEGGITEAITTSNEFGKTGLEGGSEETSASNKESSEISTPECESEESNASSEKLNTAENATELYSETTYEGGLKETIRSEKLSTAENATETFSETTNEGGIKETITTSNESSTTGLEGGREETSASNKESSEISTPEGESEESNASSEKLNTAENATELYSETTYEGGLKETIRTSNESGKTGLEGSGIETSASNKESSEITTPEGGSEESNESSEKLGTAENAAEAFSTTTYEGGIKESSMTSNESGETSLLSGSKESSKSNLSEGSSKESMTSSTEAGKATTLEFSPKEIGETDTEILDGGSTIENISGHFGKTTEEVGSKESKMFTNELGETTEVEVGSKEAGEISDEGESKELSSTKSTSKYLNKTTTLESGSNESSITNEEVSSKEPSQIPTFEGSVESATYSEGLTATTKLISSSRMLITNNKIGETTNGGKTTSYDQKTEKSSTDTVEGTSVPKKHTHVLTQKLELTSTIEIDVGLVGFESTPCEYCQSKSVVFHNETKTSNRTPKVEHISSLSSTEKAVKTTIERFRNGETEEDNKQRTAMTETKMKEGQEIETITTISEKEMEKTIAKRPEEEQTLKIENEEFMRTMKQEVEENHKTTEIDEEEEIINTTAGREAIKTTTQLPSTTEIAIGLVGFESTPCKYCHNITEKEEFIHTTETELEKEKTGGEDKEEVEEKVKEKEKEEKKDKEKEEKKEKEKEKEKEMEEKEEKEKKNEENKENEEEKEKEKEKEKEQEGEREKEKEKEKEKKKEEDKEKERGKEKEVIKTTTLKEKISEIEDGEMPEKVDRTDMESTSQKPVVIIVNNSGNKLNKLNQTVLENIISIPIQDVNIQYMDINAEENESSTIITKNEPLKLSVPYELCKKADYGQNCFCNMQSYMDTLLQKINNNETIKSKENYCNNFLKLKSGLPIESSTKPVERKRRGLIYLENLKRKGENVEYETIESIFENEYQLNITDSNLFCLPGETVRIRCTTHTDEKGMTWKFRPLSSSKDELLLDKGAELVIHGASVKNAGNYTCSKEDVPEKQHWHELEIITFPIYDIKLNIFYKINDSCSLRTGDILYLYLPKIAAPLLCSNDNEVCSIDLERPRCLTRADDNYFNVTIKAKIGSDFLTTIHGTCDINCKLRVYENLVNVIYKNSEVLEHIPVYSKLEPSRTIEFLPNINGKEGSPVSVKPPYIMVFCPSGFGLESKRQSVCVACPSHTFSGDDDAFCKTCPGGQYQPEPGSKSCLQCNSPVDDKMCLRMLYTDTKLFKIYVGVAFGFIILMVIFVIVWTSGYKDDANIKNAYFEGSLRHRAMKRKDPDIETGVRKPLLGGSPRKPTPPQLPPVDF